MVKCSYKNSDTFDISCTINVMVPHKVFSCDFSDSVVYIRIRVEMFLLYSNLTFEFHRVFGLR